MVRGEREGISNFFFVMWRCLAFSHQIKAPRANARSKIAASKPFMEFTHGEIAKNGEDGRAGGWARRGVVSSGSRNPKAPYSIVGQPAASFCCEATQNQRMTFPWDTHFPECTCVLGIICIWLSWQRVLGSDPSTPTFQLGVLFKLHFPPLGRNDRRHTL